MSLMPEHCDKSHLLKLIAQECAFTPFSDQNMRRALIDAGEDKDAYDLNFPNGLSDIAAELSRHLDIAMMHEIEKNSITPMRIRDKIEYAVWQRLTLMQDYEDLIRATSRYWVKDKPSSGLSSIWHSADMIWTWAGDTAQDYNHYTKRGLLSAVITSTTLYWLNDKSEAKQNSKTFLNRRIDNVLKFGKIAAKPLSLFATLGQKIKSRATAHKEDAI